MERQVGATRPDVKSGNTVRVSSPKPGVEVIQPFEQVMNRRAEPRFDCNDAATLLILPNGREIACSVVNQSASGAQVLLQEMPSQTASLWLIDTNTHMVRYGTPAWILPHKMGLKFSFVQKLDPAGSRPPRVPEAVWTTWRRLAGLDTPPPPPEDDAFFLD